MAVRWKEVVSSNIRACLYFRKPRLLAIEFVSGRIYLYAKVPWSVYMGFCRADSKGSYFAKYIRDQYDYQPVAVEEAERLGLTA